MPLPAAVPAALTMYWMNKLLYPSRQSTPEQAAFVPAMQATGYNPLTGRTDPSVIASARAQGLLPAEGAPQAITPGRPALGNELTTAAQQEMKAIQDAINYQLELNLGRERTRFGQMGTFMSGTRMERERELERGAQMDLANALARTALERAQIAQTGTLAGQQLALQQAQIQAQYDIAGQQRWASVIESMMPIAIEHALIPWLQGQFGGGGQLRARPGATAAWEELKR